VFVIRQTVATDRPIEPTGTMWLSLLANNADRANAAYTTTWKRETALMLATHRKETNTTNSSVLGSSFKSTYSCMLSAKLKQLRGEARVQTSVSIPGPGFSFLGIRERPFSFPGFPGTRE